MGRLLEAAPLPAPAGEARWSSGKSNVAAVWEFRAAPGALLAADGAAPVPAEVRASRDLSGDLLGWLDHPGCEAAAYRGVLPVGPAAYYYAVCDADREIYVANTRDLRAADLAIAVTETLPPGAAGPEAYEVRLGGHSYVFVGTSAGEPTLRLGRFVPLLDDATTVAVAGPGSGEARVVLHDVVGRPARGVATGVWTATLAALLAAALP